MKTQILISFLAVALCGCSRQQWEYKVLEVENDEHRREAINLRRQNVIASDLHWTRTTAGSFPVAEAELKKLGGDGWELVSAVPTAERVYEDSLSARPNARTGSLILIFKRPK